MKIPSDPEVIEISAVNVQVLLDASQVPTVEQSPPSLLFKESPDDVTVPDAAGDSIVKFCSTHISYSAAQISKFQAP